jgi:hypothetical protein
MTNLKSGELCRVLINATVFNYDDEGKTYAIAAGPALVITLTHSDRPSPNGLPAIWLVMSNKGLGYAWEHMLDTVSSERT